MLTGSDDPNNDGETAAQRKGSTRSEATDRSLFCAFLTVCHGYRVFECFIGHFIATIYYRQTQLTEDWLRFLYCFFPHPSTTVHRLGTSFYRAGQFHGPCVSNVNTPARTDTCSTWSSSSSSSSRPERRASEKEAVFVDECAASVAVCVVMMLICVSACVTSRVVYRRAPAP